MATPNLNAISVALSRKIHDPVAAGVDRGLIYTAQQRLDYINLGYWGMIKGLEAVHKDMTFVFPDFVSITEILYTGGGPGAEKISLDQLKLGTYYEIYDLYYQNGQNALTRANHIPPEDYYSVSLGYNELWPKPLLAADDKDSPLSFDKMAYWTVLDGSIKMIPNAVEAEYVRVIMTHKKDFKSFEYDTGEDIELAKNYYDLLLAYAARQAHSDDGNMAKFQTASAMIAEILKVVGVTKADYVRKDKDKEPR